MPSFLRRLQTALAGQAPTGDAGAAAPAPGERPAPAVPADLADLLPAVPATERPRAAALGADGAAVVCWELPVAPGASALQLQEALRSAPSRWRPVVVDDGWEEALTEAPQPLEVLADLDVEDGPLLLDRRWQSAHDLAVREERLGMHRGTTPVTTVTAVTRAVAERPPALEDGVVAVVDAHDAWQLPAVLGWAPVDAGLSARELSVVLQYWQDQWGAHLVALGAGSFALRVEDPPATADDALAAAQEVLAVAPALLRADLVEPLPRAAELLGPALRGAGWWHVRLA
ncbi:DUF4253 domain-containing protein [Quadrisphaera sp. KR29]|uniref:DUF4253 domain-containing protein n=1 Tax=Quadrisphaera sp. KR29 TaxID=3461391 RepID=UPI00404440AD